MDDSRTTFSYDDLDIAKDQKQVRLLKLLPSIDDADQIICTLEVADWASELHYAAISYVWGDPTIKRAILINGQQFNVTENLHSALWHIRKNNMLQPEGSGQPESLPLWVDAVCINQDSIEERNHQVPLMGSIYGSASRVIYWLGRMEDGILSGDAAIAAIHEMTEAAFHNGSNLDQDSLKKFLAAHKGLSVPVVPDLSIPNATTWDKLPQVWQSIAETLLCEFWSRVWIIQEIVLPISQDALWFTCGNSVTTWPRIVQFSELLDFLGRPESRILGPLNPVYMIISLREFIISKILVLEGMRRTYRDAKKMDAAVLPRFAKQYKVTDPRDYVYGFDAVICIEHGVDYNKCKKEVYMDWFSSVTDGGRVDLMAYAGISLLDLEKSEWPSWLPDLALIRDGQTSIAEYSTRTDGAIFLDDTEDIVDNVLHISGARLGDTVERIFEPEPMAFSGRNISKLENLHLTCFSILANASDHPSGIRPLQAFLLALVNGFQRKRTLSLKHLLEANNPELDSLLYVVCFPDLDLHLKPMIHDFVSIYGPSWNSMGFKGTADLENALKQQILGESRSRTWGMTDHLPWLESDHLLPATLIQAFGYHTTFQTANGYIGIGPRELRKGDELCFLSRGKVPMLLRTENERNSRVTKVVGPCFIHDLSCSVIQEWVASGKVNVERFSIH